MIRYYCKHKKICIYDSRLTNPPNQPISTTGIIIHNNNDQSTYVPLNNQQQEMLKNSLIPSELDYDIDDTSYDYICKIIQNTPESQLMPSNIFDSQYDDERCCLCLDPLKCENKNRPLVKLQCSNHFYHYSCFNTYIEDDKKKKDIKLLFREIQSIDEIFTINCPICKIDTFIDKIYIDYSYSLINSKSINSLEHKSKLHHIYEDNEESEESNNEENNSIIEHDNSEEHRVIYSSSSMEEISIDNNITENTPLIK